MAKEKIADGQTSLFDFASDSKIDIKDNTLQVVNAAMTGSQQVSWHDLFDGFDELYVITFSSGIDFTTKLLDQFKYAEIIYGCDAILSNDISAVMSVESSMIKEICKRKAAKKMADRIHEGSLRLFVSRDTKSHEKIFCLRAGDGRVRVVTGSANMSATAFEGIQRENILCFDDQNAFDYYFDIFENFREQCADNINEKVIGKVIENPDVMDGNIDEIPVIARIKKEQVVYLDNSKSTEDDDVVFIAEVKGHADELRSILPKPSKDGNKIVITSDDLKTLKKNVHEHEEQKKAMKRVTPKLHIDYDNHTISFNEKLYDLHPDKAKISNDINCLLSYLDSIQKFNGKWKEAQENYYRFMNWYFCSVFMAYMRYEAHVNNYEVLRFPVVGIIYGNSNGGKSTFIKLLNKLMCSNIIQPNSSNDFTASNIEKLKCLCEGVPIYIDDLVKSSYTNNAEKIIKNDTWGLSDKRINYPAIAITTNKLPAVSPDISKRAVTCRINAKISNENGAIASKQVNDSIQKAGNALFSAYVVEMFDKIEDIVNKMTTNEENYFPDILKESSDVLKDLITKYADRDIPEYIQDLTYFSYFGDSALGQNAINKIRLAWETTPKQFTVNKTANTLAFNFGDGAYYDMKYISEELPPILNAQLTANSLVMNLKEAQGFFGYRFHRSFFGKLS